MMPILKIKEKRTEEEQFEELFTEEVKTIQEIERMIMLQIQKDLETKLTQEIQEKLQLKQLEKKVIEEEEIKQFQEETEEAKEVLHGYSIEIETFYSKEQGAYQVKQLYEQDSSYENKQ